MNSVRLAVCRFLRPTGHYRAGTIIICSALGKKIINNGVSKFMQFISLPVPVTYGVGGFFLVCECLFFFWRCSLLFSVPVRVFARLLLSFWAVLKAWHTLHCPVLCVFRTYSRVGAIMELDMTAVMALLAKVWNSFRMLWVFFFKLNIKCSRCRYSNKQGAHKPLHNRFCNYSKFKTLFKDIFNAIHLFFLEKMAQIIALPPLVLHY